MDIPELPTPNSERITSFGICLLLPLLLLLPPDGVANDDDEDDAVSERRGLLRGLSLGLVSPAVRLGED